MSAGRSEPSGVGQGDGLNCHLFDALDFVEPSDEIHLVKVGDLVKVAQAPQHVRTESVVRNAVSGLLSRPRVRRHQR